MPPDAEILMIEDQELATRHRHHQQKVVLFFSAMRHFAAHLRDAGRRVHYLAWDRPNAAGLAEEIGRLLPDEVWIYEPNDPGTLFPPWFQRVPSPAFLTSELDWEDYAETTNRRKMADFYVWQRQRLSILVDEKGQPEGGRWSFDVENRQFPPPGLRAEPPNWVEPDEITRQVIQLVQSEFSDHPGDASLFRYPVTHAQAEAWLDQFLSGRFANFGPYEDAIVREQPVLFHSVLSPLLNTGLLTPGRVLQRVFEFARSNPVPMASLEGFIRQLIGWREFVRGMDRDQFDLGFPLKILPGHHRILRSCWWTGETGLPPLDDCIHRLWKTGYAHHIERLMVAGSAMLMARVDPRHGYQWFMEMFIDSADWVMRPNVYGMSLYADGGLWATKPYVSGSAYLLKMTDYPRGPWCEVWDGLYWSFVDRHADALAKNPRTSFWPKGLARLQPARRERLFLEAEAFIESTTSAPD